MFTHRYRLLALGAAVAALIGFSAITEPRTSAQVGIIDIEIVSISAPSSIGVSGTTSFVVQEAIRNNGTIPVANVLVSFANGNVTCEKVPKDATKTKTWKCKFVNDSSGPANDLHLDFPVRVKRVTGTSSSDNTDAWGRWRIGGVATDNTPSNCDKDDNKVVDMAQTNGVTSKGHWVAVTFELCDEYALSADIKPTKTWTNAGEVLSAAMRSGWLPSGSDVVLVNSGPISPGQQVLLSSTLEIQCLSDGDSGLFLENEVVAFDPAAPDGNYANNLLSKEIDVACQSSVGGIAGVLDASAATRSDAGAPSGGTPVAPVAGALALVGAALTVGGWYARRRFSRN